MYLKSVSIHPDRFPTKDAYPFNLEIFHRTRQITLSSGVTFFIGENGSGKTTLLKALSRKCGIHIWENGTRPRSKPNPLENKFHLGLTIEWAHKSVPGAYFGSQIFHHFTEVLDEWAASDPGILAYFGGRSLITQSHGQSILAFFSSRFQRPGLYLMDEPETALSPKSQMVLLNILKNALPGNRCQFIIATHSPILMACPEADILNFDDTIIRSICYKKTDHFRIYKDFLDRQGA